MTIILMTDRIGREISRTTVEEKESVNEAMIRFVGTTLICIGDKFEIVETGNGASNDQEVGYR